MARARSYRQALSVRLRLAFPIREHGDDGASAIAINPDGTAAFVTGSSGADYLTVAYSTR